MSGRAEGEGELKRLGFLKSYLSTALSYGESAYSTARGLVPGFAEPYVSQAEDRARAVAAPLLTKGQDTAADLLALVDSKVDAILLAHDKNLGELASARASYYGFVEGVVDATKSALDPQRYVVYAADIGKSLVSAVAACADPDRLAATLTGILDRVLSFGPLPKVLELADPVITVGQSQYAKARDKLLVQPLYRRAYDAASSLPAAVQGTALFDALYPLVAPVADPVVANFANAKVLRQLDEHLRPKAE